MWFQVNGTLFQRAPTLGGECYVLLDEFVVATRSRPFQRAPTLGGECYEWEMPRYGDSPPFQRAPTLGGECYDYGSAEPVKRISPLVSTGTHPWG